MNDKPQLFNDASILMIDFVGHTEMAIARDPAALVTELNDIFTVFDRITDLYGCERIRTVGDAYVAVSGLPEPTPDRAHNIARVALRMLRLIKDDFVCTERGEFEVKGFGKSTLYYLERELPNIR